MNLLRKRWLSWFILILMVVCFNINNGYQPQPEPPVRRLRGNNNEGVIVDQRRLRIDEFNPQPQPPARRLPEMNDEMSVPDAPERRSPRENKTDDSNPSIIFFRRLRGEENDAVGPEFSQRRLRGEESNNAIGPEFKGRRLRENKTNDNNDNNLVFPEPNIDEMSVPDAPERRPRDGINKTDDNSIPSIIFFRRLRGQENDAVPVPGPEPVPWRRLNEETSNGDKDIIVQDKESSLARRLQKKMKQPRQNQTSFSPVDLPIETSMDSNHLPMTTNDDEHENNNTRQPRPFPRKLIKKMNRKLNEDDNNNNNNDSGDKNIFPPGPY